jgi:hypothetical protein
VIDGDRIRGAAAGPPIERLLPSGDALTNKGY